MPLPAGLRALSQRDYRRYFTGTIVAQTGTWMQTVTQSWLVLEPTGSPFARYWHVAVVAVLWGIMTAIDQPARQ